MSAPLKSTVYNTCREDFVLVHKDYLHNLESNIDPRIRENFQIEKSNDIVEECRKAGRICNFQNQCCSKVCFYGYCA